MPDAYKNNFKQNILLAISMKQYILLIIFFGIVPIYSTESSIFSGVTYEQNIINKFEAFPFFYKGNNNEGTLLCFQKNSNHNETVIQYASTPKIIDSLRTALLKTHTIFSSREHNNISFNVTKDMQNKIITIQAWICTISYEILTKEAKVNSYIQKNDSHAYHNIVTNLSNICDIFSEENNINLSNIRSITVKTNNNNCLWF